MNEVLHHLIEIGQVDQQRTELERQLGRYPGMLEEMAEKERILAERLQAARERREAAQLAQRNADKEVRAQREQIEKYLRQQMGVKTNKEYDALNHEVEVANQHIDELETLGLENLEIEEAATEQIETLERELAELKAENDIERERIAVQQQEKQERLTGLNEEYDDLYARLPFEWQEDFDLIRGRHPGSALAAVEKGHCGGCGLNMVAHVVQDVARGETIIQCENCRRFLYDPAQVV